MHASHAPSPVIDPSDEHLMRMVREGEADCALPALERRYGREIRRLVLGIIREPSLASDIAVEAMEKVWLERARYAPGTNFRAWLLGVARNHALTALRSRRRAARVGGTVWNDRDEPVDTAAARARGDCLGEEEELNTALADAVADLPERYQTVFDLCVRQRRPYAEVSRALDLPKGTIAIRIRRARQRLFATLAHRLERGHVEALARHYATCA